MDPLGHGQVDQMHINSLLGPNVGYSFYGAITNDLNIKRISLGEEINRTRDRPHWIGHPINVMAHLIIV